MRSAIDTTGQVPTDVSVAPPGSAATAVTAVTAVTIGNRRPPASPPSLELLADQRGVKHRDCRSCAQFDPQGDGLSYGWCQAHHQFVKLYHPAGQFWSQCQFKALGRDRR